MGGVGKITGSVTIRPIRVGFVFSSSTDAAVDAARLATRVWGGIYFPIFRAGMVDLHERAERLSIDALYPLDDDKATTDLATASGYGWRGDHPFGPFDDHFCQLAPIGQVTTRRAASYHWDADDPMGPLYEVWLGSQSEQENRTAKAVWDASRHSSDSAIARTATHINYRSTYHQRIVAIIGNDPLDLVNFWNLRAMGSDVHPWFLDRPTESLTAIRAWLKQPRAVRESSFGDEGAHVAPLAHVFGPPSERDRVIDKISASIAISREHPLENPFYSTDGCSPLSTGFHLPLTAEVPEERPVASIPLPRLPALEVQPSLTGSVAADIRIDTESGLRPGWVFTLPPSRQLAEGLSGRSVVTEQPIHRPQRNGRVVGVLAGSHSLEVGAVLTLGLFQQLTPSLALAQSDDGRSATFLSERLGEIHVAAARHPSLREVLYHLSNAGRSVTFSRLLQKALDSREGWPGELAKESASDYAKRVILHLAQAELIEPTLTLRCPVCESEVDLRTEEIASRITCPVCRRESNLGYALGIQTPRNPWRYRLAIPGPPGKLRSGLAAIAALATLRQATADWFHPEVTTPHVFGLNAKEGAWECEVDLAAIFTTSRQEAAVVVGELKGGKDEIDEQDVDNLTRLQDRFRNTGINCFVLIGTTRDCFSPPEQQLLRGLCERAPREIRGPGQAFPIVLTGPDLSSPELAPDHPKRWGEGENMIVAEDRLRFIAEWSCQRNLHS